MHSLLHLETGFPEVKNNFLTSENVDSFIWENQNMSTSEK